MMRHQIASMITEKCTRIIHTYEGIEHFLPMIYPSNAPLRNDIKQPTEDIVHMYEGIQRFPHDSLRQCAREKRHQIAVSFHEGLYTEDTSMAFQGLKTFQKSSRCNVHISKKQGATLTSGMVHYSTFTSDYVQRRYQL